MTIIITITALMLAASLAACMKPCKDIVNYDYIEKEN